MAERQRACALCRNRSSTMHMLPKNPELRMKWLQFIFGTMPQQDHSNLVICSAHFEERDFVNFGEYSKGFAKRLRLKPGAIPSRQSTASAQSGFPPENVLVKVVPGGGVHRRQPGGGGGGVTIASRRNHITGGIRPQTLITTLNTIIY